jgi:hypothetical protein
MLEETLRRHAARPPQGRFANSAIAAVKDALGDTPKKSMADPATAQAREVLQDLLFAAKLLSGDHDVEAVRMETALRVHPDQAVHAEPRGDRGLGLRTRIRQ